MGYFIYLRDGHGDVLTGDDWADVVGRKLEEAWDEASDLGCQPDQFMATLAFCGNGLGGTRGASTHLRLNRTSLFDRAAARPADPDPRGRVQTHPEAHAY